MMTKTGPRIYVASLSDYNAGRLHGAWIDADQDAEDIAEDVRRMLAESPEPNAEEWAIHDYEGFGPLRLSEWQSFESVATIGQAFAAADEPEALAAFLDNEHHTTADDISDAIDRFEEFYAGEWGSIEDYAEELVEDLGMLAEMPENLRPYFDVEAFARDLILGGDYWTHPSPSGGVYVFRSH